MDLNDLKFKHPFTMIVSGQTSSGKTVLVRRILNHWEKLIDINKSDFNVLWCYGQMQNLYHETVPNVNINYFYGKPTENTLNEYNPDLIVLDDLMNELKDDQKTSDLFTKYSHHKNISVIFIIQNIFNQGKYMRNISLNSHYIIVMNGVRSSQQIVVLGSQIFAGKTKALREVFNKATSRSYGYLLFDLHPRTNQKFRLRTRITPEEVPEHLSKRNSITPIFYEI